MAEEISLQEYAKEESERILNGERLLAEPELMKRWGFDPNDRKAQRSFKKKMWRFRTGRHPSGLLIDCVPLGGQHRLYRLADVMRIEVHLINRHRQSAS